MMVRAYTLTIIGKNQNPDAWLMQPEHSYWVTMTGQPPALTILYMYCKSDTEMSSHYIHLKVSNFITMWGKSSQHQL